MKEQIIIACTEFVVLDNRPFHLIDGKSFINLAQCIFDIGKSKSKLADVNIAGILPHPTTVTINN